MPGKSAAIVPINSRSLSASPERIDERRQRLIDGGLCSVPQAAKRLGLSLSKTYEILSAGEIRSAFPSGAD